MSDDPRVMAVAEALAPHDIALRRSDLTAVCECGLDFDPCHWNDPWSIHLAEVAVAALDELAAHQEAEMTRETETRAVADEDWSPW